jgi:hypothetical protein
VTSYVDHHGRSTWINKGFGVTATVIQPEDQTPTTAPLVVVARDEKDGQLTDGEVREHGLDLQAHGSAKVLPILSL